MSPSREWVVGVDVGGSGARARTQGPDGAREVTSAGAVATSEGAVLAAEDALARVFALVDPERVSAVAVGATGFGTLATTRGELRRRIVERIGVEAVVIAADAACAHVGALGGASGVTVAAGTGAIGVAQDASGRLHRVDGWGHLLGDAGSGAWIGRRGLTAALEQFDGRRADAPALLDAAIAVFGAPEGWPARLYGRDDRAAILGSFAPVVDRVAVDGDEVARGIVTAAAHALALTARACLATNGVAPLVAFTGGVFASERLRSAFRGALDGAAEVRAAAGSPLDGAVILASRRARGEGAVCTPGLIEW